MEISIASFKTPTKKVTIHKKCWAEISAFVEISKHSVPDEIIEYQIF